MFLGGNGSGKSTIMSMLTPYKYSFDERTNLILDGCEGRKEIDIQKENHIYEIIHIYAKTSQSFIKEDGIELNENGGIRTFEDIITKKFGITKDYFSIGKIGSNTRNFVEFGPKERKDYITTFLNIEEMSEKFTIANRKLKTLKKEITSLGQELENFKNEESIKNEIEALSKSSEEIEKELFSLYSKVGALQTEVSHANSELMNVNLTDIKNKIDEKNHDVEYYGKIKTELTAELSNLENAEEEKNKLAEKISQLKAENLVTENKQHDTILVKEDLKNKIEKLKIELKSFGSPEEIENLKIEHENLKKKQEESKNSIRSNSMGEIIGNIKRERKNADDLISKFETFTSFLEKYYKELSTCSFNLADSNIYLFLKGDFQESLNRQISQSKSVINEKQKQLESAQKERGIKESYVCQLENLKKRPKECNINDCPFIREAYLHKNVLNEICEKDSEILKIKTELETLNIKAENIQLLSNLYKNFRVAYESVNPRENPIYLKFIENRSLVDWLSNSLATFQKEKEKIINDSIEANSEFANYASISDALKVNESILFRAESNNSTYREKYQKEINENEESLIKLEETLNNLKEVSEKTISEIHNNEALFEKYSNYIVANSKLASAQTMLSTANSDYKKFSEINEKREILNRELISANQRISQLAIMKNEKSERISKATAILEKIKELKERNETLSKSYKPVEAVSTALSISSGIPLILMKMYLGETELIANELLRLAFGDSFQIKFYTTEKEFSIQVNAKNSIKPDIKMASQGEIAITTISISLALIEQSIGDYNVLCLDEIDGPLDSGNRSNFINILNRQIEKLGIEQVFIISHNDVFDTASMGLILLKGNKVDKENLVFMENKNIIFEA